MQVNPFLRAAAVALAFAGALGSAGVITAAVLDNPVLLFIAAVLAATQL